MSIDHARSYLFLDPPRNEVWKAQIIFARSGASHRICVEFSAFSGGVGPGQWDRPRTLLLRSIDGFAKGQEIAVELMSLDDSQPRRFWKWAIDGDDKPLVYPTMNHCRLALIPLTNGKPDFFNFIVLGCRKDYDGGMSLIGEHHFNYVKQWNDANDHEAQSP